MKIENVIRDIKESRFGRKMDPCWPKYHQWSIDTFPINLPACTVTYSEKEISYNDRANLQFVLYPDIAIVVRVDSENGQILKEVLPSNTSGPEPSIFSFTLDNQALEGNVGIGFEWVFNIPVKPPGHYQPTKPLGVVMLDSSELLGKEFQITIQKPSQ